MQEYETVIIGAGAAGLMTAIQCGLKNIPVIVIDSQLKIGKKILISGGGRCNVTNQNISSKYFNCLSKNFVSGILKNFSKDDVINYFKKNGLPLKIEDEFQKYFPISDKASDVLNVFLNGLKQYDIPLLNDVEIIEVSKENDKFLLTAQNNHIIKCVNLIIATGGKSLPQSGSTGFGYQVAEKFGHKLICPSPALTPLLSENTICHELSGYAVGVNVSLYENNKKVKMFSGPMLFTHKGYSGPVVLNISRHYILSQTQDKFLEVNFLPEISEDDFLSFLQNQSSDLISKILRNYFSRHFVSYICELVEIPEDLNLSNLNKSKRVLLQKKLFHFKLEVNGFKDWPFAEVTSGGVDIKELCPKRLESKLCKNLFFCGEVIDVDGDLGGYNFQWAFSSGATIAKNL
ncbi:MAG: hypothetical protein COA79_08265 [Planctomycetota bacterium]|nr:MAG: hypothetical protein COA79_08265 [Planctomycetota bacterium]